MATMQHERFLRSVSADYKTDSILKFYTYWREKCSGSKLPYLTDINLMDIYQIAPQIYIRDVVDNGEEFRVRFIGTKMVDWLGQELTGKLVKESFPPEAAAHLLAGFRMVLKNELPVRIVGNAYFIKNKEHLDFETAYLPLLGADGTIQHIIGASDYSYKLQPSEVSEIKALGDQVGFG